MSASATPQTAADAAQYVGRRVSKYFPPNPQVNFPGGTFHGTVIKADNDLDGADGWWFQIKYEDDDMEHMPWQELVTCMVEEPAFSDPTSDAGEAAAPRAVRKAKRARQEDENYEPDEQADDEQQGEQPQRRQRRRPDGEVPSEPQAHAQDVDVEAGAEEEGAEAEVEEGAGAGALVVRKRGQAGHLDRIRAQNFMCHENFQMEFGLHVNVVSGQNGSGKSAVMQALQCCLGATARSTGRAASLNSFVRTGASEAIVQVTLWNTGEDAFRPAEYGDRITVERKISAKSGGGFRLLDARGRKVSGRREELQALLDHLGVNAANPLTVMTQDCSRDFLSGAVANRKKFELFMEATMLQDIELQLQRVDVLLGELRGILEDTRKEHQQRQAELHELKKRQKQLECVASMAEVRGAIYTAIPWAVAQDSAAHLAEERAKLVKLEGLVAEAEAAERAAAARLEELKGQEAVLREQHQREQSTSNDAATNMGRLREELRQAVRAAADLRVKVQGLERDLTTSRHTQQELLNSLAVDKAEVVARKQQEMAQYESQLNKIREFATQSQAEFVEHKQRFTGSKDEVRRLRDQLEQLHQQHRWHTQDLEQLHGRLEQVQAGQRSRAGAFGGQAVLNLIMDVARHRDFHRKPIGPIGAFLNLRRPECAVAVEAAIGSVLEAWVCHDQHDARVLRQLAARHRLQRLTVITASFDLPMHSVPAHRLPQPHLDTVLKLLQVEGEARKTLINVLIDQANAESTVILGPEGSRDVVYSNPPNVGRMYELDGSQWKITRNSVTNIPSRGGRPRLGTDTGAELEDVQRQIGEVQATLQQIHSQVQAANTQVATLSSQVDAAYSQMTQAVARKQQAERQMAMLNSQQPAGAEAEGREEDDEQQQLDEATEDVRRAEVALAGARERLEEAVRVEEEAKQRVAGAKDTVRGFAEEQQRIQGAIHEVAQAVSVTMRERSEQRKLAEQRKAALETQAIKVEVAEQQDQTVAAKMAEHASDRAAMEAAVEVVKKDTWQRAEGLVDKRMRNKNQQPTAEARERMVQEVQAQLLHSENLEKRLAKVNQSIEELERANGGSREELEEQVLQLEPKVMKQEAALVAMEALYNGLHARVRKRKESYRNLFREVSETVDNKFNTYMARRRHKGRVIMAAENKELTLEVRVGGVDNKKAKRVTDLKTLSGGERSYTTVAFLLALGEWTESPFRCMDEFDVFMDAVNRRIATETLLEFAMERSQMQYIFLTPQDLQAVEDAKRQLEARRKVQLPDGFLKVVQIRPARPR